MSAIYSSPAGERTLREAYLALLARWPVAHERLTIPTREGETFVVASGPPAGPPLVLLHGSGANSAAWMEDVAAWAQAFRVYAVDLIGEPGLSAPSRPPVGSDAYANWLDDVLAGLGVSKCAFAGMSLGGWMALDYAIRRPGRVISLALACPGGLGRTRLSFALKMLPLLALGPFGRRLALAAVGQGGQTPAPVKAYLTLIFTHFRPRRESLPVFAHEQLARLTMPILLVVGENDAIIDSAESARRLVAAAPEARVVMLPNTGHFISGQGRIVLDFLQGAAP